MEEPRNLNEEGNARVLSESTLPVVSEISVSKASGPNGDGLVKLHADSSNCKGLSECMGGPLEKLSCRSLLCVPK